MFSRIFSSLVAATLCFASLSTASAQEFSGNVTLASDYSFRGWSQTTRDPAIQGGFDLEFDGGFSIGTWASNINFGDSASTELDLYAGFSGSMSEGVDFSVSFIRFEYVSEGDALDYNEVNGEISFGSVAVGVNFSPAYLGDGGPSFQYPYASYSTSLGENVSLDLSIGMSMTDEDDFFADGEDSYIDYSAAVTTPMAGLDVSVALVGTNLDDINDTSNRLIISFSKSL